MRGSPSASTRSTIRAASGNERSSAALASAAEYGGRGAGVGASVRAGPDEQTVGEFGARRVFEHSDEARDHLRRAGETGGGRRGIAGLDGGAGGGALETEGVRPVDAALGYGRGGLQSDGGRRRFVGQDRGAFVVALRVGGVAAQEKQVRQLGGEGVRRDETRRRPKGRRRGRRRLPRRRPPLRCR